jgi:flagellar biosynthetic protein FliR
MFDPETGGQTPVVSMILDLFLITVFLSLNGHLIAIDFLIKSFDIYKISTELPPLSLVALGIEATGAMFYTGGLIMLPVVGALLMTNIAIGVITRSSPQLNMFSFAFPVTLLLAFFVLYLSTRTIGNAFAELTKNSLESIEILFLGR